MAIVSINFDCGCGYHARTVEEASKHADEHKHTLNVAGTVKSSERTALKASLSVSASSRSYKKPAAIAPPKAQEEDKIDFGSLRAKLQKRG